MSAHHLDRLLRPRSVAVVGASDSPGKVGYTVLRNLKTYGFPGALHAVNPGRETVQGLQCYGRLEALPERPDLVVVCTPAATVAGLVESCGRLGVPGMVVLSAGFGESGPKGRDLERDLRQAIAHHPDLRVIGPNCLGIMSIGAKLNASFAAGMPALGRVALLSQSGALCTAILDWAKLEGIGFSYFLSMGNMLDVGVADLLDYLAADPGVDSVVLYLESITNAREFMSAARAFTREKPIVAYKSGRFQESARAASSHTGAMAGVDDVYEAAFQRAGIVRVHEVDDMFACAELLARTRLPQGPRLGIVTNAGGPGVMACDALLAAGGKLAELSPAIMERLDGVLPPFWSHNNPVDVLGDASPDRFAAATGIVLEDAAVDAVLAILTPQAMTDPTATAYAVARLVARADKPVLTAWMGGSSLTEGIAALHASSVPTFSTPERAVSAFMRLVEYARRREILLETPRAVPLDLALPRPELRGRVAALVGEGVSQLSERQSKELLALYGIRVSRTLQAATAEDAVRAARDLGFPVVLKIDSPQITHKSDVRGVLLDLANEEQVRRGFAEIVANAQRLRPSAEIRGVTVQPMIALADGVSLIVGAKRDPVFGPVILVGAGGVTAELLSDRALELPPLNERLARRMLESLRSWKLLDGYRGKPKVALDQLTEALMRFSYLVADVPELVEADINPLIVTPSEVIAVDARFMFDAWRPNGDSGKSSPHLAISPCPDELARGIALRDGTDVVLRPLRPEDEPQWIAMLESASADTLRQRFGYVIGEATHELATRYCYVDYDRELPMVAEVQIQGKPRMAGVGRLVRAPDGQRAEYAVMVVDDFQRRGLGKELTLACLDVARRWQLDEVYAYVERGNTAMISLFRRLGFKLHEPPDASQSIHASCALTPE